MIIGFCPFCAMDVVYIDFSYEEEMYTECPQCKIEITVKYGEQE